jgi:signal transduction histidine kinase
MCAELVLKMGSLNERQSMLIGQIIDCTSRADEIVTNLFDLTKARFGSGLPIVRASMDMAFVSRRLVEEMNTVYPANVMNLEISGNTEGEWDKARIAQVFSNLIGNAVQYGFKGTSIDITVKGTPTEIILSVHNMGVPIPTHKIGKLFDSLSRGDGESGKVPSEPMHLGLGLYIAEEIVAAHGGKIGVESSEKDGTTFTVYLPRIAPAMKAA